MIPVQEGAGGWLAVTPAGALPPPAGVHPEVDEWLDIAEREQRAGVIPDLPILVGLTAADAGVDSGVALDLRLIDFMNHPSGAAVSSALTADVLRYQLPVFFRWLVGRGKWWDAATVQDFVAYKAHRTRVDRVAGRTWDKDHWALSRFYGWAVGERLIETNPVPPRQRREKGRAREQVASTTAVSERWRWITPGTFYLWREVGFRSFRPRPVPGGTGFEVGDEDESFRGRNVQRNVAYVDLAFSSALRRREIGTLLVTDIPSSVCEEAPLARAVAKQGRGRRWRSSNNVIAEVNAYVRHARRDAVTHARRTGSYSELDLIWVADVQVGAKGTVLVLVDGRRWRVEEIAEPERMRLFRSGADGLGEPLWLWLGQDGTPMRARSWNQVFRVANLRFATEMAAVGRRTDVAWLSPHSLRFSYGLHVLVALHKALDKIHPPDSRTYDPGRYDLAYNIVAALLGHKNEAVTRSIYLAPLQQDRLWDSVAFTEDDVAAALEEAARADPRVLDLCEAWQ